MRMECTTCSRLRGIVLAALLGFGPSGLAGSTDDPGGNRGYSLLRAPVQQVRGELVIHLTAPRLSAQEWIVYGAQMPALPYQTGVSTTLSPDSEPGRELGPEHRGILRARIPATTAEEKTNLKLRMEYQATLWSRRLVRHNAEQGGTREDAPVPPLEAAEKRAALASGGMFDFGSDAFRRWLVDQELARGPDEGEIDFARRVFLAIKQSFTYKYDATLDRLASRVCQQRESDCGGLSIVFVSGLRARRIPARLLVGRWAKSGEKERSQTYNQWHVKAEFYAQGVGWIPADLASGVVYDKAPNGLAFFGNDPGDFIVQHLDPDFICDTVHFGPKAVHWLQSPAYWVAGEGNLDQLVTRESWTVKTSEAPTLVEASVKKPAAAEKPKAGRVKSRSPRR